MAGMSVTLRGEVQGRGGWRLSGRESQGRVWRASGLEAVGKQRTEAALPVILCAR